MQFVFNVPMGTYAFCNILGIGCLYIRDVKAFGFVFFGFRKKVPADKSNSAYAFPTFCQIVFASIKVSFPDFQTASGYGFFPVITDRFTQNDSFFNGRLEFGLVTFYLDQVMIVLGYDFV